jgi:hypothetical protein
MSNQSLSGIVILIGLALAHIVLTMYNATRSSWYPRHPEHPAKKTETNSSVQQEVADVPGKFSEEKNQYFSFNSLPTNADSSAVEDVANVIQDNSDTE